MTKEQIIRPADAKEYINFQFQGLIQTLEQFDYPCMAGIVRATHSIFNNTISKTQHTQPDYILLENTHQSK